MTAYSRRSLRSTVGLALSGLALATVALAGCSRTDSTAAQAPAAGPPANDSVAGGGAKADAGGATAADAGGATTADGQRSPALAPHLRAVVYTGSMLVTVTDVVAAAQTADAVAVAAGGDVAADRRTIDAGHSEAELTLRVPSDAFSSTLDRLAHLGTERSRAVTTQDVTEDLVDLDARLATQRASVARVRALLARANTIGEIVSIESELTRREADLDSLEQRRTALSGLVALSTITLSLRGPDAPVPTPPESGSGFLYGLRSGWSAFLSSAKVFLTVAGWLAPWLVVIAVPGWLVLRSIRRRRAITPPPPPRADGAEPGL